MNDTVSQTPHHHELQVKGMTCQHCVKAVTKALLAQDPRAVVTVQLSHGLVKVDTILSRDQAAAAITDEGYELAA